LGINPSLVFDTELGSRIGGLPRVGLGAVTEHLLGLKLAKEHSAVDWSIRPLKEDWLNYAALDVDVLIELRTELHAHLVSEAKLDWALAEFEHVVNAPPKPAKIDRWRGMTGLHEVKDSKSLAVAESLWLHREELAAKLDVSPGRLIPDYSIVAVAKSTPRTKPELAGSKSFAGRASRSYLDLWWRAIEAGLKNLNPPPVRLPQTGIPNHRIWANKFPEADARLKAARVVVAALSEEHNIPPENLLTPDFLRQISWEPPTEVTSSNVANALTALGARNWQVSLLAESIAVALRAPIAEPEPDAV
jgi:ribonuclease D